MLYSSNISVKVAVWIDNSFPDDETAIGRGWTDTVER